jgi:hypothetical protein
MLIDANRNEIVAGSRFELDLDEVVAFLGS